ncbi:MAG: NADH-quinone oxidoreductase subunit M [Ktedonobacteraceae bacterium]|nr:NADH-quinone oxidoreductase subunit M [Ktedonobacteraceae bacterium]
MFHYWLTIVTFLPLLGGIVTLLLPDNRLSIVRWTALGFALLNLIVAVVIGLLYAATNTSSAYLGTYQLQDTVQWIPTLGINYSLAVDGISVLLLLLTSLLTAVSIGASFSIERKVKHYMAFMLLMESGIIGVFLAANLFLFYIFWELMLIPAYFLVGSWGGERRIYAAFKFLLYTSVGSLLMLAGIIALGYYHQVAAGGSYTLELSSLLNTKLDGTIQLWLFLAFAVAFAVKVPFFPLHSWLPDAYSEAPAPVTAMLAGAMTKTGAYGFLRLCIPLFPQAAQTLAPLFSILAVISILYSAILALTQSDLKRLIGYSSISHLGVVMLGMFAFNIQGVEGSVMQMVNHGITIVALFLLIGFLETRTGTRRLSDFGGLSWRVPVLATVMCIASLSSLGLPGLNSFAGEFVALLGVFRSNVVYGVLATAVVIPAAWYMLRFFLGIMQGPPQTERSVGASIRKKTLADMSLGEFGVLAPLLALIFYIGVQPLPLTFLMEPSVLNTMQALGSAFIK